MPPSPYLALTLIRTILPSEHLILTFTGKKRIETKEGFL